MLKPGTVVISTQGHDKGGWFVVTGEQGGRIFIADGKERPLSKAKAKNPKHLSLTHMSLCLAEVTSDRGLNKALRALKEGDTQAR